LFQEYSWSFEGKFSEHSGNIQGKLRDHSGTAENIQRTKRRFEEHFGNIKWFHSRTIQGTLWRCFQEHSGHLQGIFRERSDSSLSIQGTY
jgi:hypothetical protein